MSLGSIQELWRYPVKSVGGELLEEARLLRQGVLGDRTWAFVDAASGEIRSAKRHPELLALRARHLPGKEPRPGAFGDEVEEVEIEAPDGARYASRDPAAQARLSRAVGLPLRLAPLAPPEDRAHYRLRKPIGAEDIAQLMQLQPGEPMPDFSETPPELLALLMEHATPPGSYSDAFPVHLLTTASLAELRLRSGLDADRLRFRPNLVVDTGDARGFVEFEWTGKRLRVGSAVLAVESRTIRCSMPSRAQPRFGIAEEPRITAALVVHCKRHLGVNVRVEREGVVRVGDSVEVE
jgi:MOSC domain-containing protein